MYDTLQKTSLPRTAKNPTRKPKRVRRDFIDVLRDEIARGEFLTDQRIARTVDALAPIIAQDSSAKGAA